MAECREKENSMLEAKEIYVLMQNNYRISRNIRAQWFFKNLNKTLTFKWKTCQLECTDEIQVISAIPKNMENFKVDSETNSSCIKILPDTKVHFLSTQYRLVFCLDLSSSVSTIDIQHDNLYFEEIYSSLEQSLKSLSEPFFVPGSRFFFIPQIFITVIAHIPNCAMSAPQVLIQGWNLIPENIHLLLECLKGKLKHMCELVKKVSSTVNEEQFQFMMPHDASGTIIDGTIDGNKMIKKVLDLSADISTLKVIRYGILALQLLPENSSAGIIVLTDGILSFPNCKSLDSLLSQLRNSTIACSFIQLGSPFHPFSSFGRVPYKELMEFISTATCGAYFPSSKDLDTDLSTVNEMNIYHKALLFWNFQKNATFGFLEAYEPSSKNGCYWRVDNPHFYTVAHQSRVKKKHTEGTIKVSLENLLSCRLREGYSVKSVIIDEAKNSTEVTLILPWMLSTNIEYIITSAPGRKSMPDIPSCHFEVIVDGCYEFLHDVTCSDKKPIKSLYRKTIITQFWNYIKNLSNTDQILMQLHSFAHNPVYYTIPDSIKNGVPLFYFPNNSSMPVLNSRNVANIQFTSFWKPLCMLDINVWQKWMHAHRIGIILQHDMPLPKTLHQPNSSGRYVHVQCRQATTALNSLLSEHSSFSLVENHSYIKLLFDDQDKPPFSFYVIRVTSKPPCVVIRLAFLGGLPGCQRYEIVNDLRQKILSLKRCTLKDSQSSKQLSSNPPESCCFLLKKPVEKILIRYEKLPTNFLSSIPDNQCTDRCLGTSKHSDSQLYADALITLSKYLHQKRWIWTLQYESNTSLNLPSASKILYMLTSIRLEEGFRFSHSGSGIIYMVQELPVQVFRGEISDKASPTDANCCVVQYILFPPHTNTTFKDSTSDDDDIELTEADGELQLITECWVEPQLGITVMPPKHEYLNGLKFSEISEALHKKDMEAVTVLTTFEHLCIVCDKSSKLGHQLHPLQMSKDTQSNNLQVSSSIISPQVTVRPLQDNISMIPYCFNLISLLPKCPQTEIVISALHEVDREGVTGNELLFNYFIENIEEFHNHEIAFTLEDSFIFPFLVHHRDRDTDENPLPFPHPETNTTELSNLNLSFLTNNHKECCNLGRSFSEVSDCSRRPLLEQAELKEEYITKWRCFVKGFSTSQIIVTIVPATFSDLKKLYPQNFNLPKKDLDVSKINESCNESLVSENPEDSSCPENVQNVPNLDVTESSVPENADDSNLSPELLYIPLYVYNGVSSPVINQLVASSHCEKIEDSFIKYAFEYENCLDAESNISSAHLITPSQYSEESEAQTKKPKKDSHYFNLKDHCSLIEKSHSKAFVYSVYKSLLQGNSVHKFDAVAAIDEVCEETLLEVDITEFVSMICGHMKDFITKHSVRQMHLANESDSSKARPEEKLDSSNVCSESDRTSEKCLFPLSVLQRHQPCEHLQQKHLDIKEKFMNIINSFFKVIPSRTDYFYFKHVEENLDEASLRIDEEESHKEDSLHDGCLVEFGEDCHVIAGSDADKASSFPEEEASAKSINDDSSFSSFSKDTEPSYSDKDYPPLFVHFSCSVRRNKQEIKSCPLTSLPTCLNDVLACVDPESNEIDLDDLRITLDITCLTVPSDIESLTVGRQRAYSTSFSSSSPIPEADFYRKKQIIDENDNDSDSSEAASDTIQGGTLQNLSSFQKEAVLKCVDKIKWLLQDEKASIALNFFPISSYVLNMVVEHVQSSKDKPCCIIKEIPLMFIYGDDSLEKFIQAFKRMSPDGYRLEAVGETYYLVHDAEAAKKINRPFGSLEPPLGIADKFQFIKCNPHSDDRTELKKIAEELKDSPVFHGDDYSYEKKTRTDKLNDDFKSSSVDMTNMFNVLRDKGLRKLQRDEAAETDSEDSDDGQRPKLKFHRKNSTKKYATFPNSNKMTHSTPTFSKQEKLGSQTERPSTAPPNLSYEEVAPEAASSSWELLKSNQKPYAGAENVENWSCGVQSCSPVASSPDPSIESKDFHLTSSVNSVNRFKPDSVGSPVMYSEAECCSFPFSNTEDGYDGDSSDTGSDWDWLSTVDTRRPVLPKFWLIMNVCNEKVFVYFHMRDRIEEDSEFIQCRNILNEVIAIVTNICKEVNQILLLLSLYNTRKCNRLLVPEDNEDVWKNKDLESSHSLVTDDVESNMEVHEKYLEATLKLEPGAFSCPIVWITHFRLHHRLTTLCSGTTKSQGMQALRSVLSTFSVINRENMFVYQEDTASVFYLRLFEEICEENHFGASRHDDNMSLIGSCSSLQSIPFRRNIEFDAESEFRPRVNSGASDSYRQDSISTTSSSRRAQKCVALHVYGIGEVGSAITNDLIQVLQNRLNDSILDIIIGMLSRNPQCMLTPEDVQFIQNPNSPPTHEVHFTLPLNLLGYAHSIHIYLRQNLLNFLYNPKYTDNKPENHFKAYSCNPLEWAQKDDNDIFLYYSKPTIGQPGGKGISCIVLSLVTGQGAPYQNFSNLLPNPVAYRDGLSESEYEDIITTTLYSSKKDKSPGPVALIQFHIWSVGKDSIKILEHRLECAVRQALWDLLMEYRALTAPILDLPGYDDSGCFSEPTTPIKGIFRFSAKKHKIKKLKFVRCPELPKIFVPPKAVSLAETCSVLNVAEMYPSSIYPTIARLGKGVVRKTGLTNLDTSFHLKDLFGNISLLASKEISSSVPDMATKDFISGPQSAKPDLHPDSSKKMPKVSSSPKSIRADKGNLNVMFHSLLKPFLQFGVSLECPALYKYAYKLPSRQSVYLVSRDFLNILKDISGETPYMYFEIKRYANGLPEYIPFNPSVNPDFLENSKPGTVKNFVCIGRNELQWKAYMGNQEFSNVHENMKNYQKHQTHICTHKNSDQFVDSVPSSPTVRSNSATINSPQLKSPSPCTSERTPKSINVPHFVPRQRLYLVYIEDKEITLYLYNWPQDLIVKLVNDLSKQIAWHLQRNCLLNNIVLQKLGIFHGLPTLRVEKVSIKDDKPNTKNPTEEALTAGPPATVEQLIHNSSSPKDSHASSSSRSSVSRSAYLMRSLKNLRPKVPFHLSPSAHIKDPLTAHGLQYLDALSTQRRDMQILYKMWHSRGSNLDYPSERVFNDIKRSARLSHYCLTPILFSPAWRWRLAPIRDHALEPLDQSLSLSEKPAEITVSNRSRHSSGSSLKNIETSGSSAGSSFRSRRLSGSAINPSSNQSSPKLRMKTPSEETWHNTVCRHYLQEYLQYVITLGFVAVQTSDTTSVQSSSRRSIGGEEDKLSRSDSFTHRHGRGPPVFYLIKCLLGGLLVFEIGLSEPYAYGHLYSVEASRFKPCSARALNSQFIAGFLDDLDKVKLHMHLHSFTYDYHLRTIHSYISGRQLIFRHGYHLTSFLDDFIKYYQKAPTGAHNLLHAGTITISDTSISASQLYNYIISHNKLYGMTVLRMNPVIFESSNIIDTEFALVELTAQRASYKDFNDVFQMGNFDFGLLINQNTTEVTTDSNTLVLNYYIILTSQRYLYPELCTFPVTLGSFKTVRYGSSQVSSSFSSRKTSTVSVITERDKFESSGEESTSSLESGRSKKITVIRGMCDEDVTYLGYFSNNETMNQQVLQKQSEVAQTHLKGVVNRAAVHCRRDSLWSSLLPRSFKDESSSKEHSAPPPSSFTDFSELLELVSVIPLCDIDDKLTPFMNLNISWYITLAPVLKMKYPDSHREYKSSDGNSIYVVVTTTECPDSFLLLNVDIHANRSELSIVFRENSGDVEHITQDEPNVRTLALHSFIESFVNTCCFHLWTSML